jgi:DNA-binding transcriptional ArsR family regulator
MDSGLATLHKILKDDTRRKILHLLNEKGGLTYTELINSLEVVSTGLLNYHLKVLSDLITKNEEGKYILTGKGNLASKLLVEFPDVNDQGKRPKWWKKFWIAHGIFDTGFFTIILAAYFLNYINLAMLYRGVLAIFAAIGVGYMLTHIIKNVLSEKGLHKLNRATYIFAGIILFGFLLWLVLMTSLHASGIDWLIVLYLGKDFSDGFAIFSFIMCYVIGAFIGEAIGKKTKYYVPRFS